MIEKNKGRNEINVILLRVCVGAALGLIAGLIVKYLIN